MTKFYYESDATLPAILILPFIRVFLPANIFKNVDEPCPLLPNTTSLSPGLIYMW